MLPATPGRYHTQAKGAAAPSLLGANCRAQYTLVCHCWHIPPEAKYQIVALSQLPWRGGWSTLLLHIGFPLQLSIGLRKIRV